MTPRYQELAIFPEDFPILLSKVVRLWVATGNLDNLDTEMFYQRLHKLSSLSYFDGVTEQIHLHDVIQSYLKRKVEKRLPELHGLLLDTYKLSLWASLPINKIYLWRYFSFHLLTAELGETFVTTMPNLLYASTKVYIPTSSSIDNGLKLAIQLVSQNQLIQLLHRYLMQMSHLLNRARSIHETACIISSQLYHLEDVPSLHSILMAHCFAVPSSSDLRLVAVGKEDCLSCV